MTPTGVVNDSARKRSSDRGPPADLTAGPSGATLRSRLSSPGLSRFPRYPPDSRRTAMRLDPVWE